MVEKIDTLKIVDFSKCDGKNLSNMKTLWGENFVDFHHRILSDFNKKFGEKIHDASKWIARKKTFKEFYTDYFLLFTYYGILFETYLTNEDELDFTEKVALPVFNKVQNIAGIKPLVVRLIPDSEESNLYWWCYPSKIKKLMRMMVLMEESI